MEIKLGKRVKYAGDVHTELMKVGFTPKGAAELLDHVPDANVVTVIRCRECMYFKPWNKKEYYCSNPKGLHQMVMGDQFCSQGERSTDSLTEK